MHILVINSGSSSIKFSIFLAREAETQLLLDGEVSGIGGAHATLELRPDGNDASTTSAVSADTASDAMRLVFAAVAPAHPSVQPPIVIGAVGYRVVHPGPRLRDHQRITPDVLVELDAAVPFAPLHDPAAIEAIREGLAHFPDVPHFACFDTVFHQTMPESATTYPLPKPLRDKGLRRYGFHGLSCESVVWQMRRAPGVVFPRRLVIAHLGSGCSVTAVVDGCSIDTTMGLTPTGGVVMGTRPGDLDPGLLLYLLRQPGATVDSVEQMLNHESGLKGLCGRNDMRDIHQAARPVAEGGAGDLSAALAFEIFCRSVRKAIAGFAAVSGMDALIFTGGIGEHDPQTRLLAGDALWQRTPTIEPIANEAPSTRLRKISMEGSEVAVYVVPAEEDLMIARHVARMAAS